MKWLVNLSIAKQIGGGFAILIASMILMAVFSSLQVKDTQSINEKVIQLRQPTVIATTQMISSLNDSLSALRGWMLLRKDVFKQQRKHAWADMYANLSTLKNFSSDWTNAENVSRLQKVESSLHLFQQAQEAIEDIIGTPDETPATKILMTQAAPAANIIVQNITRLIDLEGAEEATPERKNLLGMMADVRGTMGLSLANIRAYLLTGEAKFSAQFNQLWVKNERRFRDLSSQRDLFTAEQQQAFNHMQAARQVFVKLPAKMFEIRGSNEWNVANAWLSRKAAPEASTILVNLHAMANSQRQLADEDVRAAGQASTFLIEFMWFISVMAVLIGLAVAMVSIRMITRPCTVMMRVSNELRDSGDLSLRFPDFGANELGKTADAFNAFVDKVKTVMVQVRAGSDHVTTASNQINSTAQSLSQGSSEQAASVEQTSASLEQMAASITQNSDNAQVTNTMAEEAASEAEKGGQAVKSTIAAMQDIAGKISVVEDIAYKTNMLALNAAIEAARAGEHGKGFAVVADEVRQLAEQSRVSAQEINALASTGVNRAQEAGALLDEIVTRIKKTADLINEIAAASAEQSSGVAQVNTAVGQLEQVSQHNAAASEELASIAQEMSGQALELQRSVGFFQLPSTASAR